MKIKYDIWKGKRLFHYTLSESELNGIVFEHLMELGYIEEECKDEYEINIDETII